MNALLSLPKRFAALREANVSYVVLTGFSSLPTSAKEEILILTSNLSGLSLHLQCKPTKKHGRYNLKISEHTSVQIGIVEKGQGVFPEAFETQLLKGPCVFREDVRLPDTIQHAYALLYHQLYREDLLKDSLEQRTMLKELARLRVGDFVAHEYNWLGNYSR